MCSPEKKNAGCLYLSLIHIFKSDINKIQVAFNDKADAEKGYAGLNIVHRESRGKVDLLIIRNDSEQIRRALEPYRPILFDVLPLTCLLYTSML